MDEPNDRIEELRAQAAQLRVGAIDANRVMIAELRVIWHELNELAPGSSDVRQIRDHVAADIARLEKLDLAFDTEWLAEAKRARPEPTLAAGGRAIARAH